MRREEGECSAGSRHLTAITATVLQKTRQLNFAGRAWLQQKFDALGLEYVPSHANFVMVNVGDGNAVFQALMARGIIVRAMASYQLPEWIRVTVGTPEQNARFLAELQPLLPARV